MATSITPLNIDSILDDVAEAIMNEQIGVAQEMLSVIKDQGDDIQQQMAQSYQMQIDMFDDENDGYENDSDEKDSHQNDAAEVDLSSLLQLTENTKEGIVQDLANHPSLINHSEPVSHETSTTDTDSHDKLIVSLPLPDDKNIITAIPAVSDSGINTREPFRQNDDIKVIANHALSDKADIHNHTHSQTYSLPLNHVNLGDNQAPSGEAFVSQASLDDNLAFSLGQMISAPTSQAVDFFDAPFGKIPKNDFEVPLGFTPQSDELIVNEVSNEKEPTLLDRTANNATKDLLPPSEGLIATNLASADGQPSIAEQPNELTSTREQVISQRQVFRIGATELAVEFADGSELINMPAYFRVPNAPDWLLGLANLQGFIVPIFDLMRYLQLPSHTDSDAADPVAQMLLVLQHGDGATGVVIDGLPRRLVINDSKRVAANLAPETLKKHTKAAYLSNDKVFFDLDIDSLCKALENSLL